MKKLKIALILLTCGISVFVLSCTQSPATTASTQLYTVKKGNISEDITATGNLQLSHEEDLAIEVSGTSQDPLTVQEVNVKEGAQVKQGQVLVQLDASVLQQKVTDQDKVVKLAEQAVTNAQNALNQVMTDDQYKISTAQYSLDTATLNFNKLNYPYSYATFAMDIPAAIDALKKAQQELDTARPDLTVGPSSPTYGDAMDQFNQAVNNLNDALQRLSHGQSIDTYSSTSISKTVTDYQAAQSALQAMQTAQHNLDQAKNSAQTDQDKATITLDNANDDLTDAQQQLDKANDDLTKATIVALFDGFVTTVNVRGGDTVQKGTIALQVADPNKFESDILVSEQDIASVKLGGDAVLQVDPLSLSFPAKVTYIAPTATISQGVVNYKVTVELQSLQPIGPTGSGTVIFRQGQTSGSAANGQGPSSQNQPTPTAATAPTPTFLAAVRQGLSSTITIPILQKNDVILVPNRAITRQGRDTVVQVSNNGVVETRVIQTGLSDLTNTEVTDGLKEGEQVVISLATSSTSTSSSSSRFFINPGGGGPIGR